MEDAFQVIQDLNLDPQIPVSYFAVFDGHGGDSCSLFLRQHLHRYLVDAFLEPGDQKRLPLMQADKFEQTLHDAVLEAFQKCDLEYQR
jgi:serine/threonine protein phosphatase PrpC